MTGLSHWSLGWRFRPHWRTAINGLFSTTQKFHHRLFEAHIMKLLRRQFMRLTAAAAALPVLPRIARAQTYPTKPVHAIVTFAPGGGLDVVARLTMQRLS